jgi:uncharacterized membrane protein YkvA (DUF1232 family)
LALALLYGVSPVDLVPDAIPLFGLMDDLGVFGVLCVWWLRRRLSQRAARTDQG